MDYDTFLKIHPLDTGSTVEMPLTKIPSIDNDLQSFLGFSKRSSFSNGFLRTLDPDDLLDLFPIWKWANKNCLIFMRTAFGGLFYKKKLTYFFFDPLVGERINLTSDLSFVLNIALCDEKSLNSTFMLNIYKKGIELKGVPKEDECFAFVPTLKLGGKKTVENLEIVQLKEHLYLLSQI